jgi:hypothetical protein
MSYPWQPFGSLLASPISGVGEPEGVVTAPIGTIYVNTSGGVNQTIFIKVAGAGNTGWDRLVVIDGTPEPLVPPPFGTFGMVLIGQNVKDHGSNAGIQYTTTVPNRAQLRTNQYGPVTAGPGMTGFKSRGPIGGPDVAVIDLDLLWRATAIGVAPNLGIPLAGTISIQVPTGGAVGANAWCATEFEVALVALLGGSNARRSVFKVMSEGQLALRETTVAPAIGSPSAGVAVLGAAGAVTVANANVAAGTRIVLAPQDGVPNVSGVVRPISRVVGTSFTIESTALAVDAGASIYWQLWEGI